MRRIYQAAIILAVTGLGFGILVTIDRLIGQ
jgi:hypothetical protein